jgi:colanic acid biosynthesis glycosyl transferase WcaI
MPEGSQAQRALVVSQFYQPEPGFITADVAALLATTRRTTVIAALPNYRQGRVYDGFPRWRPLRTQERGCSVWRLPMIPDHSTSVLRRSLAYGSFLSAATTWSPVVVAGRPPALAWVYQTPFTSALAVIWLKYAFGTRLVYTVADLWPESLIAAGMVRPGPATRRMFQLRRFINGFADDIICSTRGTLECFAEEGVPRSKLHYIPVWVDGAEIALPQPQRERRIVYAGNLGPAQNLGTVVEGAAILQDRGIDVVIDLIGEGACRAELAGAAQALRCGNVRFHGAVPPQEAHRLSATAMGQIVCLRPDSLFEMTVPSKLPFGFAAGTPILHALTGEADRLARDSGGGIPFSALDARSFADAVQQLLALAPRQIEEMSVRLKQFFQKGFAREALLQQYAKVLRVQEGAGAK